MALPQQIRDSLAKRDFDAVEDAWLERLEERPGDVGFFGEVGRSLEDAGEAERARVLLEMVDESLTEDERWRERLELLERAGPLLFDDKKLHPQILRTLSRLYGSSPTFEEMVDKVGLRRAVDDIPKTWKKAERLASLMSFDVGSIVHIEGKGAGRVTEVNMALESFKVELEGQPDLRVGFGGVAKLLKPLPPGHVLRRKIEEPEALKEMLAGEPAELLRVVLESYDEPRTGAEIRRDLAGIVDDAAWSSWWTAARRHPQVISAPGGRRAYGWAASSDHAEDAVWQAFEAAEARTRLELLRQNAGRDAALKHRMSRVLAEQAERALDDDPGLACEIWFGLDRWGEVEAGVAWSPEALAVRLTDKELAAMASSVQDRALRQRIYEIGRRKRRDWTPLAVALMGRESDPRALDTLAGGLGADEMGGVWDQIVSQPRKQPAAFTWLAERAKDEPEWLARNPPRLLKQVLWSLRDDAFAPFKSRLQPLADSGGTLPRLLDHLSEEQAAHAADVLGQTPALADYQRKPLLNALYLRFPSLRQEEEAPLYATPEVIEEKRGELRRLVEEEIPANRRAIEAARELGDLRENFEYKSARQRHEYLSARATALDRDLRRVRPIDTGHVNGGEVVIGSRVVFEAAEGEGRTITILGPWNSRPEDDVLSNESELAQRLLGAKLGAEVELDDGTYRIARIEPWA